MLCLDFAVYCFFGCLVLVVLYVIYLGVFSLMVLVLCLFLLLFAPVRLMRLILVVA